MGFHHIWKCTHLLLIFESVCIYLGVHLITNRTERHLHDFPKTSKLTEILSYYVMDYFAFYICQSSTPHAWNGWYKLYFITNAVFVYLWIKSRRNMAWFICITWKRIIRVILWWCISIYGIQIFMKCEIKD